MRMPTVGAVLFPQTGVLRAALDSGERVNEGALGCAAQELYILLSQSSLKFISKEIFMDGTVFLPASHVRTMWEHLQRKVDDLQKRVGPKEVIVAEVYLFGGERLSVESFGYAGPDILVVHGFRDNEPVTLYVHQHSVQIVFGILPISESRPNRQIGFITGASDATK